MPKTITIITHTIRSMPLKPRTKLKTKKPNTFDGSNLWKLAVFVLECKFYFQNFLKEYKEDVKKISFTLSYLKSLAIEWFEPWPIDSDECNKDPKWSYDYFKFLCILQKDFSNIDPVADMEEVIESIKMKDNWKIIQYNMEFNQHAVKLYYPNLILKCR